MSRITKRGVDALEAGQNAWDSELKGFGIRCRGSSKSYVLKYRYYGRQRMYTIGRHGSPWTPETARTEAKRLLGFIASGKDPADEKRGDKGAMTLGEVTKIFMKQYVEAKLKPRTIETYRWIFDRKILPALGNLRFDKITRRHIAKFHLEQIETPANANNSLIKIAKLYNWAKKEQYLPDDHVNPCKYIDLYRENNIERFLSNDELERLHKALDNDPKRDSRCNLPAHAIRLILYTGARKSEVIELKWTMVDLKSRCLHLPDSKTGKKDIHLNDQAIDLLRGLSKIVDNDFVFTGKYRGSPMSLSCLQSCWMEIRELADLQDVRLHDLRHTFASIGINSGMGLFQIGKLLGHKDIKSTAIYAHLQTDKMQQDVNKIGELLTPR